MLRQSISFGLLWLTVVAALRVNYNGYELLSVTPRNEAQLEFVLNLFTGHGEVDVWKFPGVADVGLALVPPGILRHITALMTSQHVEWDVINKDLEGLMRSMDGFAEEDPNYVISRSLGQDTVDHATYHSLDAIYEYLAQFEARYPYKARVIDLPEATYEGRTTKALKLSNDVKDEVSYRESIIVEGTIHAREWISTSSILYFIDKVLQQHHNLQQPGFSMLLDHDWYIVPVANPDGYVHTAVDRYWRKNRRVSNSCIGVDVNRNFGYKFGTTGISWHCDTIIYPGSHNFSEPEARNLRHLFDQISDSTVAYISIHSFAQAILIPWFYSETGETSHNYHKLFYVANKMRTAIENTTGLNYTIGSVYEIFNYAASGSSVDWFMSQKPDVFALSIEMRPDIGLIKNNAGFALDPSFIIPAGQELFAAFEMLVQGMKEQAHW